MDSDRKYRQRGYQDSSHNDRERGGSERGRAPRQPRENLGGPRPLTMPARRMVMRCAGCGALLAPSADTAGSCPKCGLEIHSCRMCANFDPGSRYECTKPITAAVSRKDQKNDCTFYEPRLSVERETSSSSSSLGVAARPTDARAAFENLFKK